MNRTIPQSLYVAIAGSSLLWIGAGCKRGPRGPEIVPVSGKVTLDGKPVGEVRISFQPQAPPAPSGSKKAVEVGVGSNATTGADGTYVLALSDNTKTGAVVGVHTVRLADKEVEADDRDAGPSPAPRKPRFPARYGDGSLTFEVKPPGTSDANFDIKSK